MTRPRASRRPDRLLAALAWALAACSQCSPSGAPPAAPDAAARPPAAAPAPAPVRSLVDDPTGGDAHAAHAAQGLACAVCHDCGQYAFQPGYRLPSGTPIAGGAITRAPEGTTCAVACHAPFGGAPAPIRWDLVGPLACVDCHVAQGPDAGPIATGHVAMGADAAANRAQCRQCHDTGAHLSGAVRVVRGDGAVVALGDDPAARNALCRSCHDGAGRLLDGLTAPLLPAGWSDAVAGDWHGARPGPVFGTTLLQPWVTGQAELACTACHDPHRSANAWLLGDRVHGAAVPPGAIGRNGAGAEALCAACHAAPFHRACVDCHTDVQPSPTELFDPNANHLDPAPPGAPCFWCHGHEGVRHVSIPVKPPGDPSSSRWLCDHCHRHEPVPALDAAPPAVVPGSLAVGRLGETTATVTWLTDEASTSEVQWGTAAPTRVTASDALVTAHAVTLGGLAAGTTYQVRVRSQDAQRNVAVAGPVTFTTLEAGTPTVPVPRPVPSTGTLRTAVTVAFAWSASTGLPGHALEYRVQVGHAADLAAPWADSGWLATLTWSGSLPAGTDAASATWWWRVQARDPVTGATSAWSAPGTFAIWAYTY